MSAALTAVSCSHDDQLLRQLAPRPLGKVLHLHTGTCQYLDCGSGELMWLVDASDEKHWWKAASPNLYKAVYELGVLVGVEWED